MSMEVVGTLGAGIISPSSSSPPSLRGFWGCCGEGWGFELGGEWDSVDSGYDDDGDDDTGTGTAAGSPCSTNARGILTSVPSAVVFIVEVTTAPPPPSPTTQFRDKNIARRRNRSHPSPLYFAPMSSRAPEWSRRRMSLMRLGSRRAGTVERWSRVLWRIVSCGGKWELDGV
ncbi:hypothetical protein EX30DRAFT_190886 [Ascodesmis nigricans]|uniref:Uncharacterized protein n=1 Tax=Ascodesmis nigricans TaxID=341454 RepID=A0A4S2N0M1_9PEZI|nr:hypothetical protein EX30DRAFT_190886 [Ascodesmis nigricans]